MMLIRRLANCGLLLALLLGAAACGGGDKKDSGGSGGSTSSTTANSGSAKGGGSRSQPGSFTTGSATLITPQGKATLDLSEGLYITANDAVVANFSDGDMTDPGTNALQINGSAAELTATVIGPLQRQGVSTECTIDATKLEASGLEGTFTCKNDVSGTFEAH